MNLPFAFLVDNAFKICYFKLQKYPGDTGSV